MISNIYMPARCIVGRGCVEQSGGIFLPRRASAA